MRVLPCAFAVIIAASAHAASSRGFIARSGPRPRPTEAARRALPGDAEALGELELRRGEVDGFAFAVDVESSLHVAARDEWHADERLRLDRRAGDLSHPRVEMRLVREHRLAMAHGPAGDALALGEAD